jgi:hypothetical protein
MWLVDPSFDDRWYPAKSHIVVSPSPEGALIVEVDRNRPDRWLQKPYFEVLSSIAVKDSRTTIRVGNRWYSLMPANVRPENISITWRSLQLSVRGVVGDRVTTLDGREFVWMEIDAPEAFQDAWRADEKTIELMRAAG